MASSVPQPDPLSKPNPPAFNFTHDPSVSDFNIPAATYLSTHAPLIYAHLATAALVFHPSSSGSFPKVLILQRAASDSMPLLWETPGGAIDATDPSILSACARELHEEAGLTAQHIGPTVPVGGSDYVFPIRSGALVRKITFVVEVALVERAGMGKGEEVPVELTPDEHCAFLWASEEEIRAGRVGEVKVNFTSEMQKQVLLEGFVIKREMNKEKERNK